MYFRRSARCAWAKIELLKRVSAVRICPGALFVQVSNLEPFGLAVAREDSAGNLRVRGMLIVVVKIGMHRFG